MTLSETAIDGEGGQDQDHCVDESPNKGYPGGHFKVSSLVYASKPEASQLTHSVSCIVHSQSADNGTSNKRFNAPYDGEDGQDDPYQLPAAPLHYAGPKRSDEVYAAD